MKMLTENVDTIYCSLRKTTTRNNNFKTQIQSITDVFFFFYNRRNDIACSCQHKKRIHFSHTIHACTELCLRAIYCWHIVAYVSRAQTKYKPKNIEVAIISIKTFSLLQSL